MFVAAFTEPISGAVCINKANIQLAEVSLPGFAKEWAALLAAFGTVDKARGSKRKRLVNFVKKRQEEAGEGSSSSAAVAGSTAAVSSGGDQRTSKDGEDGKDTEEETDNNSDTD
jgi:hypothetical protein